MKIDLHTHTSWGSACAYMDPAQLVEQARRVGLDGVCITEHDQVWHADLIESLRKRHDFLILGGVEVSTDLGHILVFGLHESVLKIYNAHELRSVVDAAGGVMIAAHPFRTDPDPLARYFFPVPVETDPVKVAQAAAQDPVFGLVDAIEVYNGQGRMEEGALAARLAEHLSLAGSGGSDAHAVLAVGACYTVFEADIRTEEDFMEQLRQKRFFGVDQRWSEQARRDGVRRFRETGG
jgi:hypothetical protein